MSQLVIGEILDCPVSGRRWRVSHVIAGRIRLQLMDHSLDGELAQALAHQALQRRWLNHFRLNALAGSLVLEGRPERVGRRRALLQLLQQAATQEVAWPIQLTPRLDSSALRRLGLVSALFTLNALLDLPLLLLLVPVTPLLFVPLLRRFWAERHTGWLPPQTLDLLWYGSLVLRGHRQALLLEWGIEVGNQSLKGWAPSEGQRALLADRLEDYRLKTAVMCQRADGSFASRSIAELQPGDRLQLKAGERLPCHAFVLEGDAVVTSPWSDGYSVQIPVQAFQQLPAGVQLVRGALLLRVVAHEDPRERRLEGTPVRKPEGHAPAIVERARAIHTRSVPMILLAGGGLLAAGHSGAAAGLLQFDPASDWQLSCSLLYGALQRDALHLGVVLKRPEVGDVIAHSHRLFITESVLEHLSQRVLAGIYPLDDSTQEELVQIVAGFRCRQRPFGLTAFLPLLHAWDLDPFIVDDLQPLHPSGWSGIVRGERVEIGGPRLLRARQLSHDPALGRHRDQTWIYVIREGRLIGGIDLRVTLSRRLLRSLRRLQRMGVELQLLMGSDLQLADVLIDRLDLASEAVIVSAEPEQQLKRLNRARGEGPVMVLGGADSDAALVAAADVGITIADPQRQICQDLADVLVASKCVDRLPAAVSLCRRTHEEQGGQALLVLMPHLLVVLVNLLIPINPLLAVILVDLPILTSEWLLVRSRERNA